MSDTHRAHCLGCGRHKSVAGELSWQGYCSICGKLIWEENLDQLRAKEGRFYEHWNDRTLLAAHRRRLAYTKGT